ncbi:conserved hypothetical protein [Ricinus communis]|uniref:ERG2/sigma1 receptor-like protein n=1 Tax=Ricinus communis TaxID=3988 RepID=B9RTQ0_RICCO|nr:conserved hypothetical protein [Ricinus communis]|eukprot:XP_002517119.1 uncharacterized protein LOC8280904 [Ricinus communis]
MKAYQATAIATSSSTKSTTTATAFMEERDSCYYPGCKKDANCNCDMCLASINATLDLMPISIQKSSLTKLSSSGSHVERTPVSFSPSFLSTPISNPCPKMDSPLLKSTARLSFCDKNEEVKKKMKTRECSFGGSFLRLVLGLSLIFVVEIGFSAGVSRASKKPLLCNDIVRKIGERSFHVKDLSGKLKFLQNELKGFVLDVKVSNCSHMDSIWKINQDGLLLNSRCVFYKSATEEVSIWGWPLQTAGMLKTGFSSRSFTILSGRVTEWSDGRTGYSIRKANSSWIHKKWGSSVVQLDPSTWVLEYGRSSILDYSSFSSAVAELFNFWISRVMTRMKQEFWFFSVLEDQYSEFRVEDHIKIPT